ncbi:cytochrome C biogenesis protein [Methanocella sp. CWC-04]|uniref:Cytochrome C biogenesis protein n=1 Tax=Methanooceanicella nereidis TaxID=2052831 RepID=A0AAP2RCA4_9EURY|nr:cytochrome c biogenesis CcdA family protein [Methanocella sp. CWC-04]MCD1293410.1 cytochrome C biogenesis protein [Methanocella sp. CWC-04]
METVDFVWAFIAGVVSITSPCVLPLLPGVLAYSTHNNKLTPLAIVFGLTLTFTTLGIVSAVFGSIFIYYIDYIKFLSGIFILIMGLYLLLEPVENLILRMWQKVPFSRVSLSSAEEAGLIGGVLLGISLGIVWMPCIGPILASILVIVAQQGETLYGASLLMVYSAGLGVPMLGIAYMSNILSGRVRAASKYSMIVRRLAGIVLVLLGLYYISELRYLFGI